MEEVRPAVLEASAHWTPGPWGPCRVAIEQPVAAAPSKTRNIYNLCILYNAITQCYYKV